MPGKRRQSEATPGQLDRIEAELFELRRYVHDVHTRLDQIQQLATRAEIDRLLADPRLADPKRLERHGFKAYSQSDEDGIVEEIFRRIGPGNRRFVEIGAGRGLENNTVYLLHSGWSGGWVDGDPANAEHLRRDFAPLLAAQRLHFSEALVTAENIEAVIRSVEAPPEPDLLSLDIDGNDFHIWNAIASFTPRVVVVEYNAKFRPPVKWVMPYDPDYAWNGTDKHGASLEAITELGRDKGYGLVGCNITGTNAFFVRNDLLGDLFAEGLGPSDHYHPLRLDLIAAIKSGHPAGAFVPTA